MRRNLYKTVLALAVLGALMQLVPYGRDHHNPAARQEPAWDRPRTRELAAQACFDCHSNQVRWPWYSHLAPASWLVQYDVEEARSKLNFSRWDLPQEEADDAPEEVADGEMPLWYYAWFHSGARLSGAERRELVAGLEATLGTRPRRDSGGGDSEGEEE